MSNISEDKHLEGQYERALPCPFCGSKNLIAEMDEDHCYCSVYCDSCGAEGPRKKSELEDEFQNAFEGWNSRPKEIALQQEINRKSTKLGRLGAYAMGIE